jgi:hypothetical protein
MANKQTKVSSVEESSEFVARCSEQCNVALMFSIREPCCVRQDSSGASETYLPALFISVRRRGLETQFQRETLVPSL